MCSIPSMPALAEAIASQECPVTPMGAADNGEGAPAARPNIRAVTLAIIASDFRNMIVNSLCFGRRLGAYSELSRHAAAMGETAVDGNDGAAHIGAKIRGEEDHHGGDLVAGRRPPVRHARKTFLPAALVAVKPRRALASQHFDAVSQHRAGIDADDAHTVIETGAADSAGECHQAGIAHGAGNIGRVEPLTAEPDDVDDDAVPACFHGFQIVPRHAYIAEDFQVPAGPP